MSANPVQYVTLVSGGGTPVRLADQRGAPYPTTGTGALVFSDQPTLTGTVTINGDLTYTGTVTGPYHSPLTTRGDLYYYGASGNTRLALGAAGTVLTSNGTDAVWTAPGSISGYLPLTGGTMTGTITSTLGTVTASTPFFDGTQTWNNAAVNFHAFRLNVTDTAHL